MQLGWCPPDHGAPGDLGTVGGHGVLHPRHGERLPLLLRLRNLLGRLLGLPPPPASLLRPALHPARQVRQRRLRGLRGTRGVDHRLRKGHLLKLSTKFAIFENSVY